jgi:acyl-CoA reductase-like NAD-dependent aldehyde dehydrogenase
MRSFWKTDVERALDSAKNAFSIWREVEASVKSTYLQKLADLLQRDLTEYVTLESLGSGRPLQLSQTDVLEAVKTLRYFAGWADKLTGKLLEL